MKEKYFSPTILNANTMALSINENPILESITAALMKKVMTSMSPNVALIVTSPLPPPSRKAQGAMNFVVNNSSLTERKFERAFR